jgi:hypothetical protein
MHIDKAGGTYKCHSALKGLNTLNTSMQVPKENILTSKDTLFAFKSKLKGWKKRLSSGNIEMFPHLIQVQSQAL